MTALKLDVLKKRAQIDSCFIKESELQQEILQKIRNELDLERNKLSRKDQDAFEKVLFWGDFTTQSKQLPHSLVTKIVLYSKLKEIFEELDYFIKDHFNQAFGSKDRLSQKQTERILSNFFRNVDEAIEQINGNRAGYEYVLDFIKSVLNLACYILSFTSHPGFFSTSTQPLYEAKSRIIKIIHLKNELAQLSTSEANEKEDRQGTLNTGKVF
ncbi:hypothetical protein [Legionella wadsworthii]|nr:hypothetical protein [Legionella wadsworthii]